MEFKEGQLKWLRLFQLFVKVSLAVTQRASECSASYLALLNVLYQTNYRNILQTIFFIFFAFLWYFHPLCSLWKTSCSCHCCSGIIIIMIIKTLYQVHLVRPLEVVFHRPIVQTNPGVIVAQAWRNKSTHKIPLTIIFYFFTLSTFFHHFIPRSPWLTSSNLTKQQVKANYSHSRSEASTWTRACACKCTMYCTFLNDSL